MSAFSSSASMSTDVHSSKSWLKKVFCGRENTKYDGEYIKNWRLRYFFLFDDGTWIGFKSKPSIDLREPLNSFTVKNCQILTMDNPKPNIFIIRGLVETPLIERRFMSQSSNERASWVESIKLVSSNLNNKVLLPSISSQLNLVPQTKKTLEDFTFLKTLGYGTFGKVLLCQENGTQKLYAMKILKKSYIIEKNEVAHSLIENQVLQNCVHPFITRLKYSIQTKDKLCFALEWAIGGEIYTHLSKERVFSEARTKFYAAEITLAIGYLHENNVVYRDLKLENLLLDAQGHIKLADFGLCKQNISYGITTNTFCGTPEYLAPELIVDGYHGRAVDWWGLGVVMHEMLCGRLPFSHNNHQALFNLIVTQPLKTSLKLSHSSQKLLHSLLNKDPHLRLGGGRTDAEEVKSSPFFFDVNWDDVYHKRVGVPFVPELSSETDTRYFDQQFTRIPVSNTSLNSVGSKSTLCSIEEDEEPHFNNFSFQQPNSFTPTHSQIKKMCSLFHSEDSFQV